MSRRGSGEAAIFDALGDRHTNGIHIDAWSWRRIGSGLSWVSVAALIAVMLGELDRLISSVPGGDGRSHSLNVVLSPVALTKTESWAAWAGAAFNQAIGGWIIASATLDIALVVALTVMMRRLVRVAAAPHRRVPAVAIVVYVAAEAFEFLFLVVGGTAVMARAIDYAAALGWVIAVVTTVKCLALIVWGLAILRIRPYRHWLAQRAGRIGQAIWVHRLATLAILVIVVLACIPAADLLDQLPDVQRQWADDYGWVHGIFAALALLATAIITFVLGRRRTRFLVETRVLGLRRKLPEDGLDAAIPWIIAPALLLAAGVFVAIAVAFGVPTTVHRPTFIAVLIVAVIVPVLAAAGNSWVARHPAEPERRDVVRARASWIVGDCLAVLVLVAGAIGVVRSYVAPLALGTQVGVPSAVGWASFVVPIGALFVAFGPWLLLRWSGSRTWGKRLDPNERDPGILAASAAPVGSEAEDRGLVTRPGRIEFGSFIAAVACLLTAMLIPSQIAWALGGVAVTLLAISAWVTVFGSFTLIVQSRALIAPFRWLRLKASPVLTLGILIPFAVNVIVSAYAPDTSLHAVQVSNRETTFPVDDEDPLDERLGQMQRDDCTITTGNGIEVRPVYLIAAEGGGIRAAYWTASALATLGGCAARSGFVSSGISGGSVGLAAASTVDDAPNDDWRPPEGLTAGGERAAEIVDRAKRVAGPDVVSTVILGLAVGDLFAAGSGVHVPSYLGPAGSADDVGWRWRDRAALVEAIWEAEAPGLSSPFSNEIDELTGMLMLSSTDVVTKCRLLVDQAPILTSVASERVRPRIPKSALEPVGQGSSCDAVGGMPSMLGFRELPASGESSPTADCLASLDWSTAAMLSARFAIVTPTGGLPAEAPCDGATGAQFVDGGYVEPTSLAALADTAPRLMDKLAARNDARASGRPWLLPVLLYLRNTQGYDLADDAARAESEPLVPITGGAAKGNLTAEDAWIQRITLTMPGACPDGETADECRDALNEIIRVGGLLPGGTVVIAPASTPAVVPPLGWALSEMSQARFTTAMQAAAGCAGSSVGEQEQSASTRHARYNGLAELADVIDFKPCGRVAAQEDARTAPG